MQQAKPRLRDGRTTVEAAEFAGAQPMRTN
jgi:hypothetical protein